MALHFGQPLCGLRCIGVADRLAASFTQSNVAWRFAVSTHSKPIFACAGNVGVDVGDFLVEAAFAGPDFVEAL